MSCWRCGLKGAYVPGLGLMEPMKTVAIMHAWAISRPCLQMDIQGIASRRMHRKLAGYLPAEQCRLTCFNKHTCGAVDSSMTPGLGTLNPSGGLTTWARLAPRFFPCKQTKIESSSHASVTALHALTRVVTAALPAGSLQQIPPWWLQRSSGRGCTCFRSGSRPTTMMQLSAGLFFACKPGWGVPSGVAAQHPGKLVMCR